MGDAGQIVIVGGGAVVVITAIIGLATFLLSNNTVAATHTEQIAALTKTVTRLEARLEVLQEDNELQHSLKHAMRQDVTKALFPLEMVLEAEDFGVVERLKPMIGSFVAEFKQKEADRRARERALEEKDSHP